MKPSCVPFSGEISGSTAVIMPIPMKETELTSSTTPALTNCGSSNVTLSDPATTANRSAVRSTP